MKLFCYSIGHKVTKKKIGGDDYIVSKCNYCLHRYAKEME